MIGATTSEDQLAAALDEAISARQAGRAPNYAQLVAQFPDLADALNVLDLLRAEDVTLSGPDPTSPPLGKGWEEGGPQVRPDRIGPYSIERELGAGGFGTVYQAFDPHLKRRVALKVLHAGRLDQPETLDRFQREACATARLRHPHIVQLYDYSREGPPYYLATELVEGEDLRAWSRHHGASPAEVAGLLARVAEAIDAAHAQGVYHRDLKPGNVLVDAQGNPHVLDFGLARLYREIEETSAAPTSDGRILGTLAYMAPEQAAGHSHQADARSDVYSLGVILYELLTGRLPFEGPAHALPTRVIENEPPPPRQIIPNLPRELEAICLKALAKHPDDRYRSAAALARDLRAFLRGEPVEARPFTWITRLQKVLNRRHRDVLLHDWRKLLFLEGLTIFTGCTLVNGWELLLDPGSTQGLCIVGTKLAQIAVMLYLVWRYRPIAETDFTSAERQIWALVPAYYGGFFTVVLMNLLFGAQIPMAPILAVLSGMAFVTLGATIWGWFYVWGSGFFGLAFLMLTDRLSAFAMLLLGLAWFVCLTLGSWQLRFTR